MDHPRYLLVALPICYRRVWKRVLSLSARRWTSKSDQTRVSKAHASGRRRRFDDLVVKYTPRLYGLVYNMTSNHEDTTTFYRTFSQSLQSDSRFRGKSSFTPEPFHLRNMTLNFLRNAAVDSLSLDDVDASIQRQGIQGATATSSPVREPTFRTQRRLNEP